MVSSVLFGLLITFAVVSVFVGIWRLVPRTDPVEARLSGYGYLDTGTSAVSHRPRLPLTTRLVNGFGLGPKLAEALTQADIPLTAAEYSVLMLGASLLGLVLGTLHFNFVAGLVLGGLFGLLPILYCRVARRRRYRAFTNQLPDVLTLLVGSLRAGYGLNQGIDTLVDQLPAPSSKEFARVSRATGLGVSVPVALQDMAIRVGSDDLDLVVTAIVIHSEMGGNLATVLEKTAETVRERIRILREVQVLTAQQRLSSYIVAGMPIFIATVMSLSNPDYFQTFVEHEILRYMAAAGVMLIIVGFMLMRRIADIEV